MDEYKEYLYKRLPPIRNIDAGDLTEQKMLRERLHCKSFKWFMEEVAFDQLENYPAEEPPILAQGHVRFSGTTQLTMLAPFGHYSQIQNENFFYNVENV